MKFLFKLQKLPSIGFQSMPKTRTKRHLLILLFASFSSLSYANLITQIQSENHTTDQIAFEQNKKHIITRLHNRGYEIRQVQLDNEYGKAFLQIQVIKSGHYYNITIEYPSLRIISKKSIKTNHKQNPTQKPK